MTASGNADSTANLVVAKYYGNGPMASFTMATKEWDIPEALDLSRAVPFFFRVTWHGSTIFISPGHAHGLRLTYFLFSFLFSLSCSLLSSLFSADVVRWD